MIYKTMSSNHPQELELIESLIDITSNYETNMLLIGAMARDIVLRDVYNYTSNQRKTIDYDLAVIVESWEHYQNILVAITEIGFQRVKNTQRLFSSNFIIDVIPIGKVEANSTISWPPDFDRIMNVMGFHEVYDSALMFSLENGKQFRIASLPGLVILKLIAWSERNLETNKDAEDLLFILNNYNDFDSSYLFEENSDLLTSEGYDYQIAGAIILARHVSNIIKSNLELKEKLITILNSNLTSIDECKLLTHSSNKSNDFLLLSSFKQELAKQ
ncbi:MAG: hypothetical protein WC155_01275 [Candidatus Cloacimonadales bacterium]